MPRRKTSGLGHEQAMAFVRVGGYSTAALADTGTKRSIVDREIADKTNAKSTGRRGRMNIAGHSMTGELMRVRITEVNDHCSAIVDAFVPDPGQAWRKGILIGMDFMQKAKMQIDAETGEVACKVPKRRRR